MTKAHSISFLGTVERYADAIAKLRSPGDYVLVVRGVPRTIVMSCPDGCGETLTINLDRRTGPAWRKYEHDGRLSIYPSIWKDTGCRAHFIVWRNRILWCGLRDESRLSLLDEGHVANVLKHLPTKNFVHFESIAEELHAIPWEIYWACKELVIRGCAIEGKQKGTFCSITKTNPPASAGDGHIDVRA